MVSDHGLLSGLADDDHPQYGALDQDEVVTGQWRIADTTIGLRFGPADGPTLKRTASGLQLDKPLILSLGIVSSTVIAFATAVTTRVLAGSNRGVSGQLNLWPSAHSSASAYGLYFGAWYSGAYNAGAIVAAHARTEILPGSSGTIGPVVGSEDYSGLRGSPTIPNLYGHRIHTPIESGFTGSITTYEALEIQDYSTPTTVRLIEAGPSTPYLRLRGGANPSANQTNLYLKEGSTLRHVQVMDPGAGGANFVGGERVAILV